MIEKKTLSFLTALKKNNNKPWFDSHKEQYLSAKENVEEFIGDLLPELCRFDPALKDLKAKDCIFRIYRDVRFAKDKRPYKTNMGASISAGGKKSSGPGYYLHIEPGKAFLAGGIWMPEGDQLRKIRQEIDYNTKEIKKILADKTFKKYYGGFDESYKLKTTPKGYAKDHPEIELLKLTSYIVYHEYNNKEILSKNFAKEIAKGAKIMKPVLDFLATAIS